MTRGLDGRTALQLHAAALAVGIAGVAVLGAGGLLGVPQLCAAHMVIGVHRAVGLPAHGADRRADAGGRAALVFSGQLLPRQHRQPFAAAGQPLADTFGIPRMRAVSTPADQRRQHRAVGKRLGALAGCTISLCVCRSPQEIARLHGAIGDLRTGGSLDRTHIVAVGHRAAIARDAACVLAAGRDRAHVVAVGHRARAATGDAAHAVGAGDRTGIAAGRHLALVIAHDAAGILGRAIPPAKLVNAHNDALVPAVQDGRPGIGVPRDAAHTGPSVHIARHRQVFHRGALQPAEQPGRINCILNSGINDIFIAAAQTPDGVAAAVKGAGVGPLLAADGIQIVDRLTGSRCVTAIRVKRTAVDHDVVGQHGAQVGPAEPVHLQSEQQQLLHAADPAGILLRAAARCVAGHRCPVLVGRVALVDHLTVMLTALIEPAQESMPLLVRTLRHHGEKVLAQHLPRIGLAVRLIRQNVLLLPLVVPCHFPVAVLLADDRTVDDLYRLILVKAAAADGAAHQRAVASVAGPALTRHLTVECTAGDGAAVLHRARKRASLDGALVRHRVLKRTVLDGAAHLVHHRVLERTAADGALALHSTGKHAVLDAAVALHRAIEITAADNSGFLRAIARSAVHRTRERTALDGAVVLHLVLERTVLDGAALLVRHLTRKRTAVDGALILNRALELTFFDDTAAVVGVGPGGTHRTVERGGAGRSLASGDGAPYISDRSAHCAVRYGERALVLDTHAAIHLRSITGIDTRYAAGYHAAGDGLIAVFIRHPRTVLVYAELPLRLCFRAVRQRHVRVFPRHRDEAVFSSDRQHMVVQIQRDRTCDLQRAVDGHVLRQRIHAAAQAVSDIGGDVVRFQLCSGGSGKRPRRYAGVLAHGAARRQHLHRQQRQHHTQRHQCGNDPFFHACSSFSSAGAAPR